MSYLYKSIYYSYWAVLTHILLADFSNPQGLWGQIKLGYFYLLIHEILLILFSIFILNFTILDFIILFNLVAIVRF